MLFELTKLFIELNKVWNNDIGETPRYFVIMIDNGSLIHSSFANTWTKPKMKEVHIYLYETSLCLDIIDLFIDTTQSLLFEFYCPQNIHDRVRQKWPNARQ